MPKKRMSSAQKAKSAIRKVSAKKSKLREKDSNAISQSSERKGKARGEKLKRNE